MDGVAARHLDGRGRGASQEHSLTVGPDGPIVLRYARAAVFRHGTETPALACGLLSGEFAGRVMKLFELGPCVHWIAADDTTTCSRDVERAPFGVDGP